MLANWTRQREHESTEVQIKKAMLGFDAEVPSLEPPYTKLHEEPWPGQGGLLQLHHGLTYRRRSRSTTCSLASNLGSKAWIMRTYLVLVHCSLGLPEKSLTGNGTVTGHDARQGLCIGM